MSIYKYNDEIEFNLPYGYEHVTEEFDEVGLCECIIYGPEESVYGDTFYDFLLPVVEVSISEDFPQFRGFSSNEILHNLGNENGMKYIVTNAANPIKLALRGQLLAATIQYASIKLWIPVSSDKLLCLSEGAIQKRDEEVKIYLPDKIAHILKVAKGISINGKPLDVSGLNANKLAEVLEPSFDDAECEDVTAKLYGKNTKTAAIKKKETHMATGKNRRINVEDCWTIEIPKDWVEDNDSDEDKLLCVKSNREDDFSKEQGYTQRLTISSTCGNVNLYGDDLTTPAAKREIKSALSAWESNRKECLPILEMMDDVMGEIKEAKHTSVLMYLD